MFSIKNHVVLLDNTPIKQIATKKTSGKMKNGPKYVVIHYTAGINFEGDVRILSTADAPVSCHLVLGPNGELTQVGKLNDIEWHAGKSFWDGISGLNSYAIGIEVTCPGWVELSYIKDGIEYFKYPANGKVYWNSKDDNIVKARHKNGGGEKYWVRFTEKQMEVLRDLVPALMKAYNLKECVGHDMIAPTRKIDPGPCLPEGFYDFVNGRKDDNEFEYYVFNTKELGLNVRDSASSRGKILFTIHDGEKVNRIKTQGSWWNISTDKGKTGWVYSTFLKRMV